METIPTEAWITIIFILCFIVFWYNIEKGNKLYRNRKYLPRHLQPGDKFLYRMEKVNGPNLYEVTYEARVKERTEKGVVDMNNNYITLEELDNSKDFAIL